MDAMAPQASTEAAARPIPYEIDVETLKDMADAGASHVIVDVREPWEVATCSFSGAIHVPMQQIPYNTNRLPADKPMVVVCHHGVRSLHVMSFLRSHGFDNATSLRGGIDAWAKRVDRSMATY